jgi:putative heme-binding domain-containing protein
VFAPGQSPADGVPLAGGVWRYHPTRKVFEPLSHGTTNPWGHDWTDKGEGFFVNSVNGHLWHLIPGAHYRRPHTLAPNPLVYRPMDMHADHWHFDTAGDWMKSRDGKADEFGGGHAHSGAMIYHGGQWPEAYRGRLLTLNLHGRRANVERLERVGSGFVGRREPDILKSADPFFRGLDVLEGPDGSVFVLDWSDTGECHEHNGVHRNSGRIFRVTHGEAKPTRMPNLRTTNVMNLPPITLEDSEWLSRAARQELAARPPDRTTTLVPQTPLGVMMSGSDRPMTQLRAMWALHAMGSSDPTELLRRSADADESVRAWVIRLLTDDLPLDTVAGEVRSTGPLVNRYAQQQQRFIEMARTDPSGLVRLTLASTLQRLPVAARPELAAALLSRAEDAADPNLPLLTWYGLIPVAQKQPLALAKLAAEGKFPVVREFAARRFAETVLTDPAPLDALLAATRTADPAARADILTGLAAGLAGIRKAPAPKAWADWPKDCDPALLRTVGAVFGDGRALADLKAVALDPKASLEDRKAAVAGLIAANPPDLQSICEPLLKVRFLNTVALGGLVGSDDPAVGKSILAQWGTFHPSERPAVVAALASRPALAAVLLDAVEKKRVPATDLSAAHVRQIRTLGDKALSAKLAAVWGEVRESPAERAADIAKLKADLTPATLAAADPRKGRAVFAATCANCHKLYGVGADTGPDLTGAGRSDLDYLLGNIVDPSAVVTKDYRVTVFQLLDGRTVTGVVAGESPAAVTVQTATAKEVLPAGEIEKRTPSASSLMPDGLLQPLTKEQVRDLFAYLMTPAQVELPTDSSPKR